MKQIKKVKGWGIYQNSEREIVEYGFNITALHPDNMEYAYMCSPSDTDMECQCRFNFAVFRRLKNA